MIVSSPWASPPTVLSRCGARLCLFGSVDCFHSLSFVAKGLHNPGHTYEGEWPRVGLGAW